MRRALGARRALLLTTVGVCLACVPPQEPSFIVNETSAPLQVRYGAPFSHALGTPSCTLLNDPPVMWPNEDNFRSRRDSSNPSSLEYLVIESRGGTREWRRWEAVAQFRRASWSGWCYLRVRE